MKFNATQIAAVVQGTVEGNPEVTIHALSKIEEGGQGSLSFLANPKYEEYLYKTKASVVIVKDDLQLKSPVEATLIRVKDPYTSFALLLKTYEEITKVVKAGISAHAVISEKARIGKNVYIGDFVVVDDHARIEDGVQIYPHTYIGQHAKIKEHTIIYSNVSVYTRCEIGEHCIVHAGAVIGADGFGFAPQSNGQFEKIPQLGNVVIEDYVEIGANTTIDRATMGSTLIKSGAKLDNLVQIAHNVEIGENTVIASQAGISGSTKIGKNNMIGGQAGIVGHIATADNVRIQAQSGLAKSITEDGAGLSGTPADEYRNTLKSQVLFRKLPELAKKIEALEKKLDELNNQA